MGFRDGGLDDKVSISISIKPRYHIQSYSSIFYRRSEILGILGNFWIIKHVGLEISVFAIMLCHPLKVLPLLILCFYRLYFSNLNQ